MKYIAVLWVVTAADIDKIVHVCYNITPLTNNFSTINLYKIVTFETNLQIVQRDVTYGEHC